MDWLWRLGIRVIYQVLTCIVVVLFILVIWEAAVEVRVNILHMFRVAYVSDQSDI